MCTAMYVCSKCLPLYMRHSNTYLEFSRCESLRWVTCCIQTAYLDMIFRMISRARVWREESEQSKQGCVWTHHGGHRGKHKTFWGVLGRLQNTSLGERKGRISGALSPEWSVPTGLRKRGQPSLQQAWHHSQGYGLPRLCGPDTPVCSKNWAHPGGLSQAIKGNPGLFAFRTCSFSNISHNLLKLT